MTKKTKLEKTKSNNLKQNKKTTTKQQKNRKFNSNDEFTLNECELDFIDILQPLGLRLKYIEGDGNCMFRALSDQFVGHPDNHPEYREQVCNFMLKHRDHFAPFVNEDEGSFDDQMENMKMDGTYGGQLELVAFANFFKVNIHIYNDDGNIMRIAPNSLGLHADLLKFQPVLHIAYHSWEHYSSIRKQDGPIEGLPEIEHKPTSEEIDEFISSEPKLKKSLNRLIQRDEFAIDDETKILLINQSGDVDKVLEILYERQLANAAPSFADMLKKPRAPTPPPESPIEESPSLSEIQLQDLNLENIPDSEDAPRAIESLSAFIKPSKRQTKKEKKTKKNKIKRLDTSTTELDHPSSLSIAENQSNVKFINI